MYELPWDQADHPHTVLRTKVILIISAIISYYVLWTKCKIFYVKYLTQDSTK